jgi:hypothetical protein
MKLALMNSALMNNEACDPPDREVYDLQRSLKNSLYRLVLKGRGFQSRRKWPKINPASAAAGRWSRRNDFFSDHVRSCLLASQKSALALAVSPRLLFQRSPLGSPRESKNALFQVRLLDCEPTMNLDLWKIQPSPRHQARHCWRYNIWCFPLDSYNKRE